MTSDDINKIYADLFKLGREMLADEDYYDGIGYFRDEALKVLAQRK
jgi:hypothetical protein